MRSASQPSARCRRPASDSSPWWRAALLSSAALGSAGCFGVEYTKSDGTGGAAPSCDPFTLIAPAQCDQALLTDPNNCCVAGRSCLGGLCDDGRCQAVTLSDSNAETIDLVVVGDTVVYSSGYGSQILSVPVAGGLTSVVVDHTQYTCPTTDACATTQLVTDGSRVYWTQFNGSEIWSVDPAVGTPSAHAVATTEGYTAAFGRLAVDGQSLFWITERDDVNVVPGAVWTADKDGVDEAAVGFEPGGAPYAIAVDDADVYFTDREGGVVRRVPRDSFGTTPTPDDVVTGIGDLMDIALDGDEVYFADGANVFSVPKQGGVPSPVGSGLSRAWDVAIDGDHVYWTDQNTAAGVGIIRRAPLGGGLTEDLADDHNPQSLAIGCDAVYYTVFPDSGDFGWVSRFAK